ncbi:agmatinase [Castellaniella sp.]|uniref:agmatinase n=2 Tax=Castellaniella sp. TaxID=1955812 RepID=UPI003566FA05
MKTATPPAHAAGTDTSAMTAPRYTGIATFMRTPLASSPGNVDIGLVGVPYDGGVTNRAGARHGPRELRNASSMTRTIHHVTRINPYALCRVADLGDVPLPHVYDHTAVYEDICSFYQALAQAGVRPLSAGGDHSITFPILAGLHAGSPRGTRPPGIIHIDAHTDTWGPFMGSKFHHGGPFHQATEAGVMDPRRTIQIGIRGAQNTPAGWDYSRAHGMRVMFIEEFDELGVQAVIAEIRRVVGEGPVYLSFDIDALDPAYAPGTGTPEVGGISTLQAQTLLRGLRGLDFIGGDLVEVAPPFDPSGNTALVGATLMYEILCLLAERCAAAP